MIGPVKSRIAELRALNMGREVVPITDTSGSSVSVSEPKSTNALYDLSESEMQAPNRVYLPARATSNPSANESRVPVCPIFFVPNAFLICHKDEKLVLPDCLASRTIPSEID